MNEHWALALAVVLICGWLNRVRGGGYGGQYLPGRPLIWVTAGIFGLALCITNLKIAAVSALGYAFWATFSWGHTLAGLSNHGPLRPKTSLEKFLDIGAAGAIVRMMFILPGIAIVAWLTGNYYYLVVAPVFACLSVLTYKTTLDTNDENAWTLAEVITGAIFGLFVLLPLGLFTTPYLNVSEILTKFQ